MTSLVWDELDTRYFSSGVSKVIVYHKGSVIPWSGVKSINVSYDKNSVEPLYFDGVVYRNFQQVATPKASISAYMYPENFEEINGVEIVSGVTHHGVVNRSPFALCWQSSIDNSDNKVIHMLYDVTSTVSNESFETDTSAKNPGVMSWELFTAYNDGLSYISVDSRNVSETGLAELETYLYGSGGVTPRLYNPDEIESIVTEQFGLDISKDTTSGINRVQIGGLDVTGSITKGIYKPYSGSPLNNYGTTGLFKEY